MESSHRRIINDLEEKHRQEIERLLCEKEQALAEETQVKFVELLHELSWILILYFHITGNISCTGRNAKSPSE